MPPEKSGLTALKSWLQFIVGMAIIALLGFSFLRLRSRPDLRSGWLAIVPPNDVMALVEYQGAVWSGGKDGLYRLDLASGKLLEQIVVEEGPDFRFTKALLVSEDGTGLWVGHLHGLSYFNGITWQTYTRANGLADDHVLALAHHPAAGLWIGTQAGLSFYDPAQGEISVIAEESTQTAISVLFIDRQANLWAGDGYTKEGGLFKYDGSHWASLGVKDGLVHPRVNVILETDDGWLWYGTGFSALGGLSIYDGQAWQTITKEDGLAGEKVRYLFQDAADVIWVGSEYNGIVRMGDLGWQTFTPENGLVGWEIKAMLQDSLGNLWLGTENGLTRISHKAWLALDDFSK